MKIVAVCGAGVGTSGILKVNIERALQRIGEDAEVVAASAATLDADAEDAQIVFATKEWAERARATGWADVIVVNSILDLGEIERLLRDALL